MRLAALAPSRPGSDAAGVARLWSGPTVTFTPTEVHRADVIVDAVFGAGLARPVDGLVADTLKAARRLVAHFPIEVRFSAPDDIWLSPAYHSAVAFVGIIAYKPYGREPSYRDYFKRYEEVRRRECAESLS